MNSVDFKKSEVSPTGECHTKQSRALTGSQSARLLVIRIWPALPVGMVRNGP